MVSLTHPKSPLPSLQIFSSMKNNKTSSSTSTSNTTCSSLTTMKIKTLLQNLVLSHICRFIRALSKAKSIILEVFRDNQLMYLKHSKRKNKYRKKILFGSFRLHYNWCSSSHVLPFPSTVLENVNDSTTHTNNLYYDSTWNSVYATENPKNDQSFNGIGKEEEGELSSYLEWLEEKGGKHEKLKEGDENVENEIDKLADMFIASCHEKFRLEKIESYRRYQELLARSL